MAKLSLEKRVERFRQLCIAGIKVALAKGKQHRSYECHVSLGWPSYFTELAGEPRYQVNLSCSLLGVGNHHSWSGRSWESAFRKAEQDLRAWVRDVSMDPEEA